MNGITNWDINQIYSKYDIVSYGNRYFFAMRDNLSGTIPVATDLDLSSSFNFTDWLQDDYFAWKPTNASNVQRNLTTKRFEYGDGYLKRFPIGLNNVFDTVNLNFDRLSQEEANAIVFFLKNNGGSPFIFKMPYPYEKHFYFTCSSWNHKIDKNYHSITANFIETFTQKRAKFTTYTVSEDCSIIEDRAFVRFTNVLDILPISPTEFILCGASNWLGTITGKYQYQWDYKPRIAKVKNYRPDTTFTPDYLNIKNTFTRYISSIKSFKDGSFIVLGDDGSLDGIKESKIRKYDSNGIEQSFIDNNITSWPYDMWGYPSMIYVDSDDKIYIASATYNYPDSYYRIAKFNKNGSYDINFGNTGEYAYHYLTAEDSINRFYMIQNDNYDDQILINEGSGIKIVGKTGDLVQSISLNSNFYFKGQDNVGKLIGVYGDFSFPPSGNLEKRLMRLNLSGLDFDSTFKDPGSTTSGYSARGIDIRNTGSFMFDFVNNFMTIYGQYRTGDADIESSPLGVQHQFLSQVNYGDSTLLNENSNFNALLDGEVRVIKPSMDGGYFVGGKFKYYGTTPLDGFVKINGDGTIIRQ